MAQRPLDTSIRWSGLLIALGLLVQAVSLSGLHPLAFVLFLGVACPLIGAGVLLFLYAIVSPTRERDETPPEISAR